MNQLETKHDIDDDTIKRLAVQSSSADMELRLNFGEGDAIKRFAHAVYAEGQRDAQPQPLRLPEPMTEQQIYDNDAIMAANSLAGLLLGDFATVVWAIEAETLRRVRECNDTPPLPVQHSDDAAVDRFAAAMKVKLEQKRAEGRGGWDDPEQCPVERLAELLHKHVGKGDPVDVANFSMMLWCRGGRTTPSVQQDDEALELLRRVANHLSEVGNHGDSFGWRDALKDARALIAKRGSE